MKNYRLIEKRFNEEIKSEMCYYEHIKSGARVLTVSNDDANKVFSVAFRTPPTNDTGVPHILEHSTLCGSKKFPVKDPFVELLKGSLNTFLNAMTYPDKTIYPVASCNDKDFANLMEVYLDAVFYPNVYVHEEIFKQEGWHYELLNKDDEITYNGVVYNEMKGAFSSADQVIFRNCMHSSFPDTPYGVESGGDPEFIPDLTYEQFCGFHKKFYHPVNSYIYIYGNCDMEERLEYLDSEYLSKFDRIKVDSEIALQKPFDKPHYDQYYYPVGKDESLDDKTFYAYNAVIGKAGDNVLNTAFNLLTYVLFEAPGAPLKQALLDANIGKDILSGYEPSLYQTLFTIIAKDAPEGKIKEFEELIKKEFEKVYKAGLDKDMLRAALNNMEFANRESDFGGEPKGLVYNLSILDNWLYNDADPFSKVEALKVFKELREKIETNYFEELIKKYILDNNHVAFVTLTPSKTCGEEAEKKVKDRLAKYKASLSDKEIEKLIADTKALKEYQATPSSKEELATLPKLTREDISSEVLPFKNEEAVVDGVKVIKHDIFTNGITYLTFRFDVKDVKEELVPYVGLLSDVLKLVNTKNHTYATLDKDIMLHTGGISVTTGAGGNKINDLIASLSINVKYIPGEEENAINLVEEILTSSTFEDKKRLREIIAQEKSRRQMMMLGRGHVTAAMHALSYVSKSEHYADLCDGIDFYSFIEGLDANFDKKIDEVISKLELLKKAIFTKKNLIISAIGKTNEYETLLPKFNKGLFSEAIDLGKFDFKPLDKGEGFKTSSTVQFTGLACVYEGKATYNGALQVFGMALRYDYLWNKIRVLGGAYGSLARLTNKGYICFGSYRDPKLRESYQIYDEVVNFIDSINYSDTEVTNFIIGAIGLLDTPLTPLQEGTRSFNAYLSGTDINDLIKERNEVINTTLADLKALRGFFEAALSNKYYCTIGNENKVEECKDLFKEVKNLYK